MTPSSQPTGYSRRLRAEILHHRARRSGLAAQLASHKNDVLGLQTKHRVIETCALQYVQGLCVAQITFLTSPARFARLQLLPSWQTARVAGLSGTIFYFGGANIHTSQETNYKPQLPERCHPAVDNERLHGGSGYRCFLARPFGSVIYKQPATSHGGDLQQRPANAEDGWGGGFTRGALRFSNWVLAGCRTRSFLRLAEGWDGCQAHTSWPRSLPH